MIIADPYKHQVLTDLQDQLKNYLAETAQLEERCKKNEWKFVQTVSISCDHTALLPEKIKPLRKSYGTHNSAMAWKLHSGASVKKFIHSFCRTYEVPPKTSRKYLMIFSSGSPWFYVTKGCIRKLMRDCPPTVSRTVNELNLLNIF